MVFYGVSIIGVLIAAVVSFVFGSLYYSKAVLGNTWMKLAGISKKQMKEAKEKGMLLKMVSAFVSNLLMAAVLSMFLVYAGASSFLSAIFVAFLLWLGFVATTQIGSVLWEGKKRELFFLNTSYSLLNLVLMATVLHLF